MSDSPGLPWFTHPPPQASIEENIAADAFRKTLIPRADDSANLLWHGWALFDAFIAGIRWQQQRAAMSAKASDEQSQSEH
jgi:hypothetical protein